MNCKCFKCAAGYDSVNEDDIAGDGQCVECKEKAKAIAFRVDIEMGKRRSEPQVSRIRQMFTEEQIVKGEIAGGKRLTLGDLGIKPSD